MRIDTSTPGSFCWVELSTIGAESAKRFYTELFGWTTEDKTTAGGTYSTFLLDGLPAAAVHEIPADHQQNGIAPHWLLYIAVDNVAFFTEDAVELGGTILVEPAELSPYGKLAVINDPQGAVFALWEPIEHHGAKVMNEPGAFSWAELATHDPEDARDFYLALFEWGAKIDTVDGYTQWTNGRDYVGGMLELPSANRQAFWKPFFRVNDCEESAARLRSLGGTVLDGPTEIPGVGPFAVVQDPQGAVFAMIEIANQ